MTTIILNGCAPIPLAHYLKALGVLRLISGSEHGDMAAAASWCADQLLFKSRFDANGLVSFFLTNYEPTPVLAPWNGGGGFFHREGKSKEKDTTTGKLKKTGIRDQETAATRVVATIGASKAPNLSAFRTAIKTARTTLTDMGVTEAPKEELKEQVLARLRNTLTDVAVSCMDATVILGMNKVGYPPLMGTGGTDGNLDFTNNFMQRITEVIDTETGKPMEESERWLRAALFGSAAPGLTTSAPIGQFFPGAAGGVNATSGFDAPSAVNPWDFILMIEGAILFAAASVKRLESTNDGSLVYPFCVRQTSVGYTSAASADEIEARCEMWMPLWSEPTSLAELRAVLSEGRAQVRGRPARNGVDFAQAAVTLGVDRGIAAFQRYGFHMRNGKNFFATPLERVIVRRNARADLLADIEGWHDRLRQKAGPRANPEPPASVSRALNQLERRIVELCRDDSPSGLQSLIAALGGTERTLARSFEWTTGAHLRPLNGLKKRWLDDANDNSPEFRLAQSVAAMRAWFGKETLWFRQHLEPVIVGSNKERSWISWDDTPGNDVAWHDGDLTDTLNAILTRRLVRTEKSGARGWPDWSPRPAGLSDITAFIERRTNDALLADLIWGLSLVDWEGIIRDEQRSAKAALTEAALPDEEAGATREDKSVDGDTASDSDQRAVPSSFYALLRLCFRHAMGNNDAIPIVPAILNRAMNGDGKAASELGARRLRASGRAPLVKDLPVSGDIARRTASAILFPIRHRDFHLLERMILKPQKQ